MVKSVYGSLTFEEKIIESDNFNKQLLNSLKNEGITPNSESKILDLGCGAGLGVYSLRKLGFKAYGVDFSDSYNDIEKRIFSESMDYGDKKIFFTIDPKTYKLPFDDSFFDLCQSRAVFEHVMDYEGTLKEIKRILKKGGVGFHTFVSKYKIIEDHTYVPFSSIYHGE